MMTWRSHFAVSPARPFAVSENDAKPYGRARPTAYCSLRSSTHSDGTAQPEPIPATSVICLPNGALAKAFTITIMDDNLYEGERISGELE